MIQRPDNLTELVLSAIRQRLIDSSLPPGSGVSEAMLSKDLNVSKTPVREALVRLRQIGLVEPTSRGLRVVVPTPRSIRDAFEMRAGLESTAARYAATRGTKEQKAQIVELARQSAEVANVFDDFRKVDQEFHMAIAAAAGNKLLHNTIEDSLVLTQVLRQRDIHVDRDFAPDGKEHIAVARSIKSGNADTAAERLSGHTLRIMEQLLDAFARENEDVQSGVGSLA